MLTALNVTGGSAQHLLRKMLGKHEAMFSKIVLGDYYPLYSDMQQGFSIAENLSDKNKVHCEQLFNQSMLREILKDSEYVIFFTHKYLKNVNCKNDQLKRVSDIVQNNSQKLKKFLVVNETENSHPLEGDLFYKEANEISEQILKNIPQSTVLWHDICKSAAKELQPIEDKYIQLLNNKKDDILQSRFKVKSLLAKEFKNFSEQMQSSNSIEDDILQNKFEDLLFNGSNQGYCLMKNIGQSKFESLNSITQNYQSLVQIIIMDFQYNFLEKLGEGSTSKVYKALRRTDGQIVAIKIIPRKFIEQNYLTEQIAREISIMKSHKHKNLLECTKSFEDDQNIYIESPYCKDGNLLELLKSTKLSKKQAFTIMCQIKDAYEQLYNKNYVHRDIKPENILIFDFKTLHVKIADFGSCQDKQLCQTLVGTRLFLAPEVESSNTGFYNYKADFYSLGLVFWIILFGVNSYPFDTINPQKLWQQKSQEDYNFPKDIQVPETWQDFFEDILKSNPEERMDGVLFFNHVFFSELENFSQEEQEISYLENGDRFDDDNLILTEMDEVLGENKFQMEQSIPMEYSMMTNQMKITQVPSQKSIQFNPVLLFKNRNNLNSLQREFIRQKACEFVWQKYLEIVAIKEVSVSLHKPFKTLAFDSKQAIIMLRSILLVKCHKKTKENKNILKGESKTAQNEIFKFLDQCPQIKEYFIQKFSTVNKSIQNLEKQNNKLVYKYLAESTTKSNKLFDETINDKTLSIKEKKENVFQFFKNYKKCLVNQTKQKDHPILQKIKLVLQNKVIDNIELFLVD